MKLSLQALALVASSTLIATPPTLAQDNLTILLSSPDLAFPFSIHIMNEMRDEAEKLGGIDVIVSDGQRNSGKQSADIEAAVARGVAGIVISPNDSAALAPAIQEAVSAGVPVVTVDRTINGVEGILAHVGADNVKGGEAQADLIQRLYPDGAKVMILLGQPGTSAAIDRAKGLHNILDGKADTYPIVFEDTASFDRSKALSVTEAALAALSEPPDAIAAANDDMALGAIEAVKAAGLTGKVAIIGFDALPEALGQIRNGNLTATIEQMPGIQGRTAVDLLNAFLRDQKRPDSAVTLLTPKAITLENLSEGERLGELN